MLPQAFLLLTLLRLGLATAQDVDLGCFKNITDGHRVLVANTMSISFCRVHCKNEHGPHMAQGYDDRVYHIYSVAKETCSCLEELPDRDLKVETSRCDVPCAGDDFELCRYPGYGTTPPMIEKKLIGDSRRRNGGLDCPRGRRKSRYRFRRCKQR